MFDSTYISLPIFVSNKTSNLTVVSSRRIVRQPETNKEEERILITKFYLSVYGR